MTTWLPVTDLGRAQGFYQNVLELPLILENRENGWAEFALGSPGVSLALCAFDYLEEVPTSGGAVIRLFVSNLETAMEELREKGVVFVTGVRKMNGSVRLCDFVDPDGNTLQLAEDVCRDRAGSASMGDSTGGGNGENKA
jgi:predicted enzyme related to lactoylglutathione lyase